MNLSFQFQIINSFYIYLRFDVGNMSVTSIKNFPTTKNNKNKKLMENAIIYPWFSLFSPFIYYITRAITMSRIREDSCSTRVRLPLPNNYDE